MDFQQVLGISRNDAGIYQQINLGTNGSNPSGFLQANLPGANSTHFANAQAVYANITGLLASSTRTFNVETPTSGFVPGDAVSNGQGGTLLCSLRTSGGWVATLRLRMAFAGNSSVCRLSRTGSPSSQNTRTYTVSRALEISSNRPRRRKSDPGLCHAAVR